MLCLHTGLSIPPCLWSNQTPVEAVPSVYPSDRAHHKPGVKSRSDHTHRGARAACQRQCLAVPPLQAWHTPRPCSRPPPSQRRTACSGRRQLHRKQWLRRPCSCTGGTSRCQASRSGQGPGPYGDWPPGAHWTDVSGDEEENSIPALSSITSSEVDNQVPQTAESATAPLPEDRIHHIQLPKPRQKLSANGAEPYSRHGGVLYPPGGQCSAGRLASLHMARTCPHAATGHPADHEGSGSGT